MDLFLIAPPAATRDTETLLAGVAEMRLLELMVRMKEVNCI